MGASCHLHMNDRAKATHTPTLVRLAPHIRGLPFWRFIMPKGQQRGNKEAKKPKKDKPIVLPAGKAPLAPLVPDLRKKK